MVAMGQYIQKLIGGVFDAFEFRATAIAVVGCSSF